MRNKLQAFIFMLAFLSLAYPFTISGTVKSAGGSVLTSNIELWDKDYAINTGASDSFGKYSISAQDGQYLLIFKRDAYPDHVFQATVSGADVERNVVMQKTNSFVYGKVSGSSNPGGTEILLLKGSLVYARTTLLDEGEFAFAPVPPGTYTIKITLGGTTKAPEIYVQQQISLRKNIDLQAIEPGQPGPGTGGTQPQAGYSLSVPESVSQNQRITATLTKGGLPVSGEKITITTPIGEVERITDASGRVSLTASDLGVYRFSYGGLSYVVYSVSDSSQAPPPEVPAQKPEESRPDLGSQPLFREVNILPLFAVAGFVVILCAILLAAIFFMRRKMGRDKGQPAQELKAEDLQSQSSPQPHGAVPDEEHQTVLSSYEEAGEGHAQEPAPRKQRKPRRGRKK